MSLWNNPENLNGRPSPRRSSSLNNNLLFSSAGRLSLSKAGVASDRRKEALINSDSDPLAP
jgi:hypothetical protein